jgi:hypothetical protein
LFKRKKSETKKEEEDNLSQEVGVEKEEEVEGLDVKPEQEEEDNVEFQEDEEEVKEFRETYESNETGVKKQKSSNLDRVPFHRTWENTKTIEKKIDTIDTKPNTVSKSSEGDDVVYDVDKRVDRILNKKKF